MLQELGDNKKGIVSYILVGFLVVVMALFGMESLFSWNPSADKAADVNGERITVSEVENGVQRKRQELIERFGNNLPASVLSAESLGSTVLDELIARKVLVQAAKSGGMAANDASIWAELASSGAFNGPNGTFDNQLFVQRLAQNGMTVPSFLAAEREATVLRQLYTSIAGSEFVLDAEVNELVGLLNQERSFKHLVLPKDMLAAEVVVSDAEINEFYQQNEARFTKPEQVAVDYIELNVDALATAIDVSDDDARAQFALDQANAKSQDERRVAHILIENDASKVSLVEKKLAEGADFAEVAKEFSDDFGSRDLGGDLGYTSGADLPAEFVQAMLALGVGQTSGAVKTELGTHFIKVDDIKSSSVTFESARVGIIEGLKRSQAEVIFSEKLAQLRDLSYNADSLQTVAQEMGLPVANTGLFTQQGGEKIAANSAVVEAAFSEDVMVAGNASEPIELSDTHVVVIKKTADEPSHLLALADVSAVIKAELHAKKLRDVLAEKGRALAADIKSAGLESVAAKLGSEVKQVENAKRSSADNADPELVGFVFSMARPQAASVVDGFVNQAGDYVLVELLAVNEGANELEADMRGMIAAQIAQGRGQADFVGVQTYLVDQAEVDRK